MQAGMIPFLFLGNVLCLDFINTEIIAKGQRLSLINDFADLRNWLVAAGVISEMEFVAAEAAWNGGEKEAALREALSFRALLRRMAEQVTQGAGVSEDILEAINDKLMESRGHAELVKTEQGYIKTYHFAWKTSLSLLAPVAASAADLLAGGDLSYLRKCENPACILYFYDVSKNHKRRWCSMNICGNRFKVAAHYKRQREQC